LEAIVEGRNAKGKGIEIARGSQEKRVALTEGGIEIRREGRPVTSQEGGGGLAYLVIDCSGSMAGEKLASAKRGAAEFAGEARKKGYSVGLIRFSTAATHVCEPQKDVSGLQRYLATLEVDGSTNMAEGITLATNRLKGMSGLRAMIVVTDGMPDSQEAAMKAATQAKQNGVDIITIGTDDADRGFLRKLASRSDLSVMVARSDLSQGIASTAKMLPEGNAPRSPRQ
jgi:Mg-chelatase subunit ChlD